MNAVTFYKQRNTLCYNYEHTTMKTNTDHFANLYYKPRAQKSRVKALLDGSRLPFEVADLLQTAFNRYHENDDEGAAFYIIELCEMVKSYEAEL